MRLLGIERFVRELTRVRIPFAIGTRDVRPRGVDGLGTQIHRIRSHVCDMTRFVQLLRDRHGLKNGESQLARRLLLQRGGGEGGPGGLLRRLGLDGPDGEFRSDASVQELAGF